MFVFCFFFLCVLSRLHILRRVTLKSLRCPRITTPPPPPHITIRDSVTLYFVSLAVYADSWNKFLFATPRSDLWFSIKIETSSLPGKKEITSSIWSCVWIWTRSRISFLVFLPARHSFIITNSVRCPSANVLEWILGIYQRSTREKKCFKLFIPFFLFFSEQYFKMLFS